MVAHFSDDGWLQGVRHLPSLNCNLRPTNAAVNLLIIHNISLPPAQFGGGYVDQLFCNTLDCNAHPYFEQLRDLRVSAHFFIDRSGEVTNTSLWISALGTRVFRSGMGKKIAMTFL